MQAYNWVSIFKDQSLSMCHIYPWTLSVEYKSQLLGLEWVQESLCWEEIMLPIHVLNFSFFSLRQFFQICLDIYEYTPTQYNFVSLYFPENSPDNKNTMQTLKCQVNVVISGWTLWQQLSLSLKVKWFYCWHFVFTTVLLMNNHFI